MASLLERVAAGMLPSSEALASIATWGTPTADVLLDDAWHALVHFDHDEDIRASDAAYAAEQAEGLRRWAGRLRGGPQ